MDECPAILLSEISAKTGDHCRVFAEENEAIEHYKNAERIVLEASKSQSVEAFDDALPKLKPSAPSRTKAMSSSAKASKAVPKPSKTTIGKYASPILFLIRVVEKLQYECDILNESLKTILGKEGISFLLF